MPPGYSHSLLLQKTVLFHHMGVHPVEVHPVFRSATVVEVNREARDYVDILLREPEIPRIAAPGQFLMVWGWPGVDPMLPRPFDIVQCNPRDQTLRLFVKVEGRGSALLGSLKPGAEVKVTGPLGRPIEDYSCRSLAFLLRGAGAAAVVYLAEQARARGIEIYTILSASTASRLVCRRYLEPVSTELLIATDDGSEGHGGLATVLLDRLLKREAVDRVYTCGSRRFARHVQRLDEEGTTEGFVFLEGLMACGMGDCHGCAVKKKNQAGYYLVCRDGPHFPIGEVQL
jgi:dihydroorotate dehydrogenase electron transfer subunit